MAPPPRVTRKIVGGTSISTTEPGGSGGTAPAGSAPVRDLGFDWQDFNTVWLPKFHPEWTGMGKQNTPAYQQALPKLKEEYLAWKSAAKKPVTPTLSATPVPAPTPTPTPVSSIDPMLLESLLGKFNV